MTNYLLLALIPLLSWTGSVYSSCCLHEFAAIDFQESICSDNPVSAVFLIGHVQEFDYCKPIFYIGLQDPLTETTFLWWQISSDPAFASICPALNQVVPFAATLALSDLQETCLNPGQLYYFRARTATSGWSQTYSFRVDKPAAIEQPALKKCDELFYELSWEPSLSETAEYLVFASQAVDFIPALYAGKQINALFLGEDTDEKDNSNLIASIKEPRLVIDGRYSYYRLIVHDKGAYSVPSPLIRIDGHDWNLTRTSLKQDREDLDLYERQQLPSSERGRVKQAYPYNPHVPAADWDQLVPYFLPFDHPVREKLDRIFTKKRATLSKEAFEEAGFGKVKIRQPTNIVVGKNPRLKSYLIKAYLDTQPPLIDWVNWVKRITGASSIRESIKKHGFKDFIVPQKWIYPLPEYPSPPNKPDYHRKNFILVVEDMKLLSNQDTLERYKKKVTKEQLNALYTLLSEIGLIDSVFPDNIPFTKEGKIAFIDTEHHHQWPVNYQKFKHFLSPSMQAYWQQLIDHNGTLN